MKMTDSQYLNKVQYKNPENLNARILIHSKFSTGNENWADFIFRHLLLKPEMKILALGCGNATQWRENQQKFPPDVKFFLTDLSHGMLVTAKDPLKKDNRFTLMACNSENIPFLACQFDRVTANHMLYHVPHIDQAFTEVARVIRPNGILMAATNGETHMQELYDLVHAFEPSYTQEDAKHTRFSLENGASILSKVFPAVMRIDYDSNLWVTDAVLLTDYVYSMWDAQETIHQERKPELVSFFQRIIDKEGGVFIRKSTGIFLASLQSSGLSQFSD